MCHSRVIARTGRAQVRQGAAKRCDGQRRGSAHAPCRTGSSSCAGARISRERRRARRRAAGGAAGCRGRGGLAQTRASGSSKRERDEEGRPRRRSRPPSTWESPRRSASDPHASAGQTTQARPTGGAALDARPAGRAGQWTTTAPTHPASPFPSAPAPQARRGGQCRSEETGQRASDGPPQ